MKKSTLLVLCIIVMTIVTSCNDKKLTEVVEVPLPTAEEKIAIGSPEEVKAIEGSFQLEKLGYNYDALTPNLSTITLETHYSKHYLSYTNNLNKAIAGTALENLTIEEVLAKLDLNDATMRNNAGGYYNHSLYWKCIGPKNQGQPKDTLASAIIKDFGSFDNFTSLFKAEASKQFGSSWVWLVVDNSGKLQVTTTQNQDNPLMPNAPVVGYHGKPILALDLWEHAYYLEYQHKRKNYIDAFFDIINWNAVGKNYEATFKK